MPNINNYQADVRVALDGKPLFADLAGWNTYTGGDLTANTAKARAGSMGSETDTGGQATRSDATLTRNWNERVLAKCKAIQARVGPGRVRISVNWLDSEGVAIPGAVFTKTGSLKGANEPSYDANGNAVGMFTITVGMDEEGS